MRMPRTFQVKIKTLVKRLARTLILLVLSVVLFVGLLIVGFFLAPKLELSAPRLAFLVDRFGPRDWSVSWTDASLEALRVGYLGKNIRVRIRDFCVEDDDLSQRVCFERFEWGFGFTFDGWRPRITEFAPLLALGGRVRADLTRWFADEEERELDKDRAKLAEQKDQPSLVDRIRTRFLPRWRVSGSRVDIPSLTLRIGDAWLESALSLTTHETDVSENVIFSIRDLTYGGRIRAGLEARLEVPREFGKSPGPGRSGDGRHPVIRIETLAQLPRGRQVQAQLNATMRAWGAVNYRLSAKFLKFAAVRAMQARGAYQNGRLQGVVGAKIGGFGSQVRTLDFVDCTYDAALGFQEARVSCGPQSVTLGLRERARLRNRELYRLFPTFDLDITNLSWDEGVHADWDLDLELQHLNMLRWNLQVAGRVLRRGATEVAPAVLEYAVDGESRLAISNFARLVRLLRPTPFAIPAPLNQLSGPLEMSASGLVSENGGEVPFEARLRLSGQDQKVYSTIGGRLNFTRTRTGLDPSLRIDVALEDVRLSLPRVDVTKPLPKLLPDSRFRRGLESESPSSEVRSQAERRRFDREGSFDFRLRVATPSPGGLKIATNLTHAPLPITLRYMLVSEPNPSERLSTAAASVNRVGNLQGSENESGSKQDGRESRMAGRVTFGRTPVDISGINQLLGRLKRDARLEHFEIDLLPNGKRPLDGKFTVQNPDAVISIMIGGTLREPTVRFESVPPASEDQIIAALLFARPIHEPGLVEQESAAAFRTAVNETALTLAQMYLLANTPIDNLSYNSETGRVIASVKIAGGTSLEFGGARGAGAEVGIRRRLARNVYLNTYVENTAQSTHRLVNAFVEWVRRF